MTSHASSFRDEVDALGSRFATGLHPASPSMPRPIRAPALLSYKQTLAKVDCS